MKKRLLGLILALGMVVAIVPMALAATEESAAVAKIGDTEYTSLKEAINALNGAQGTDTVTMEIMPGEHDVTVDEAANDGTANYGSCFIITRDNVIIKASNPNDKPVIYGFTNELDSLVQTDINDQKTTGQDTIYIAADNVTLENLVIMPLGNYVGNGNEDFVTKAVEVIANNEDEESYTFEMTGCTICANDKSKTGQEAPHNKDKAGRLYLFTNNATITGNSFEDGTIITAAAGYAVDASGNYWGKGVTPGGIADRIVRNVTVDDYYTDEAMETEPVELGGIPVSSDEQLQTALEAAKDGDTIYLAEGTYNIGTLNNINKAVSFKGAGAGNTILKGSITYTNLTETEHKSDITVEGITLQPGETTGSHAGLTWGRGVSGYTVTVKDCIFDGWQYAVNANSQTEAQNTLYISGTTFTDTGCAVAVREGNTVASFTDSICDGYAVQYFNGAYSNPDTNINGYYETFENYQADAENGYANPDFDATASGAKLVFTADDLVKAINDAGEGGTVTLAKDITVSNTDLTSDVNNGVFNISKSITIDGNGHTISAAEDWSAANGDKVSNHIINVTQPSDGAEAITVNIKNLTIDGKDKKTKHGINVFTAQGSENHAVVNLENVTIQDCGTAGLVINNSDVVATNLVTSGNPWYGVNVDPKSNSGSASFTLNGANSSLSDENGGIKVDNVYENATGTATVVVNAGYVQSIQEASDNNEETTHITVKGGRFGSDVTKYLADGLVQNSDGSVGYPYIPPADPSYQITIPATANGTVTVSPASAKEDQVVTITVTPNSGYELASLAVTDRNGNRVTVTANPDGTYRFVMPASQVTVSAVFAPAQLPFTDVTEANWYYDEVYYVWANGLMQGTSATTFGPNVDTTRAMVVTILWRLEGEPASGYDMDYSDVAGGAWYADAVRWATEHGIVNGSEGQFYPGGIVTREQLAAMLYRYAQYKGYDLTAGGDLSGFADAGAVSGWAETSLAWAVGQGLLQGSDSQVDPQGSAIRAQTAAILMRFCENTAN